MKQKAFTLIELLVVIAIIGALSSIVLVSLKNSRDKAKIAKGLAFSQSINHGIGAYAVGIWTFDECASGTSPTTVKDTSGYKNDGTNNNNALCTDDTPFKQAGTGLDKRALKFNGSYISTSYVQSNVTAYTIEVWVETTDTSNEKAFVQDRGPFGGGGQGLTLGIGQTGGLQHGGPGQVGFEVDSDDIDIGISSVQTINDGNWHYVVGVWSAPAGTKIDTSQFKIYIDGNESKVTAGFYNHSGSDVVSPLTGLGGTRIARHDAWTTYFNGTIDDVRIYNSILTAGQIQKHYAEGLERHGLAKKQY